MIRISSYILCRNAVSYVECLYAQITLNGYEQKFNDFGRSHIVDQESFIDSPGVLMRKVVPADNSCLFTSVGYVLNGKHKH